MSKESWVGNQPKPKQTKQKHCNHTFAKLFIGILLAEALTKPVTREASAE